MGMNSASNVIICIGNGSELSNNQAKDIANQCNIKYHGFLNNDTKLIPGVYHTSIYDIKLVELVNKINGIGNLKIVVLNHNESHYNNPREFYDTLEMAHALVDNHQVEFVLLFQLHPDENQSNHILQLNHCPHVTMEKNMAAKSIEK